MPSVPHGPLFDPGNTVVILVSFEGPDRYAQAVGLAVRVTGLAQTLANHGYETHLFFLGDPRLPGEETHGRLEAMAARGLVYTGGTGEDYAEGGRNSVVLESLEAEEIVRHAERLARSPGTVHRLRRAAYRTARTYTWDGVIRLLFDQLDRRARMQGLLAPAASR